jgi:hypothetical protein
MTSAIGNQPPKVGPRGDGPALDGHRPQPVATVEKLTERFIEQHGQQYRWTPRMSGGTAAHWRVVSVNGKTWIEDPGAGSRIFALIERLVIEAGVGKRMRYRKIEAIERAVKETPEMLFVVPVPPRSPRRPNSGTKVRP